MFTASSWSISSGLVTLFDLLLIYLLVVQDRPVAKSKGVLPRAFGFAGTFFGVSILQLPVAHLSLGTQVIAALLVGLGSLGSFLVLWRLGKSFSILLEAAPPGDGWTLCLGPSSASTPWRW